MLFSAALGIGDVTGTRWLH